ncbi:GFA family protein [Rhizobium sp. P007]|uniref:GFA family protein n=1 Tax=Rhizobium sp. P007 TaxID=285908 RepID=UPI000EC5C754|nr:GFA family protein [Rhizobium sp. P007]KAB2694133.1 GFA family protein [Ochrobactrum sp. Kaboul]CAD7038372.1 GFA family protein [Rhizobium sp. P007]HCJ73624.1 aldehyde-activating protein [Agrobacterium sp.]
MMLRGECLCRAVSYRVEDSFLYALNCHCSNCRRATGAAFKPFAAIEVTKLEVIKGEEDLCEFGDADGQDIFCATCGSLLYSLVMEARYVHVTLGTLIDQPSVRPSAHIFVGSKAPWFDITDALPQHDEYG